MELTRREILAIGSGTLAVAGLGGLPAYSATASDAIMTLTGGTQPGQGEISIKAPEIAENGNTVPIEVSAPGAVMVALFADGNPVPHVAKINFGPLNASHTASTRIRLAQTQNVIAVAQMQDGSFQQTQAEVKVTIGGCGG